MLFRIFTLTVRVNNDVCQREVMNKRNESTEIYDPKYHFDYQLIKQIATSYLSYFRNTPNLIKK